MIFAWETRTIKDADMLKIMTILLLCFYILGITACSAQSAPQVEEDNKLTTNSDPASSGQGCEEWDRTYGLLSSEGKQNLEKAGVAINGSDEKANNGYYVLSRELMNDCNLRVKIGQFLYLSVDGIDTETDRQFAKQNSKEIVKILRHIWNSSAFSSDGVSHEKYLLLTNKGITDENISPFIGELLKAEDLNSELVYVLVNRPLRSLKPVIMELRLKARKSNNIPQRIYSLIALEQASPDPTFRMELDSISKGRGLSPKTKHGLEIILAKFKNGQKITFADVEYLGLPLPD